MMKFKAVLLGMLAMFPLLGKADSLQLGAGQLLNNIGSRNLTTDSLGQAPWHGPGYLIDLVYRHGPVQISLTKVFANQLGEELNVSAIYRHDFARFHVGVGAIVSQSYKIPDWWWASDAAKYGFGTSFSCQFCGIVGQVGVRLTKRTELQVRYWGTERFVIPSHNGALMLLSYKF